MIAALVFTLAGLIVTSVIAREVTIGLLAFQDKPVAVSDWSPVLDHLHRVLPEHDFRLLIQHDANALRQAIAERRVDLVVTNPGYYVGMEAEFGLSRIATLVSPTAVSASRALGAVVLARADRQDLREISDLTGKRIAAVAPDAFGGYLIIAREMQKLGIDPESDFQATLYLGLPMQRVIDAVRRGEADAGIVRACLPEQLVQQGRLPMAEWRVLSPRREEGFSCALSSPLYPDWPIAVTRQTDPALAKAVARALFGMPETADGLNWTVPADYQPVHDLYRELRVGPYAYLRDITPEALARRFWPWLLGILALLLAWIVHTVRVEHLVQLRTAELRDSLRARELAETRMRENQEQMEHLSRLSVLGELSGNLAHELNQPLTTIGTYARSVTRRQASGSLTPEAVEEACNEIANEAERAGGIVQRIRHFARKRTALRAPVDLAVIAEEARRLVLGLLARPPSIDIENRAEGNSQVLADGPQIQQVLLNLIKNAIDAGRKLPAKRQAIEIIIEASGNCRTVHVLDQGVGLSAEQLSHLFEPFFTTKPDGLGLGLSICKTIIEAHGGRLWAESNPDRRGMRFSFLLPCHESSA